METFRPHVDSGNPELIEDNGVYTIICDPGDKGRFLGENFSVEPETKVRVQMIEEGNGVPLIIWWKSINPYQFLSSSFLIGDPIDFVADVPDGATHFRVELRGYEEGIFIFKDIVITYPFEDVSPPPPPEKFPKLDIFPPVDSSNGEYELVWSEATLPDSVKFVSYNLEEALSSESPPVWVSVYSGSANSKFFKKTEIGQWSYRVSYYYQDLVSQEFKVGPISDLLALDVTEPNPPDPPPTGSEDMYIYNLRRPDEKGTSMVRVTITPESITFLDYDWFDYLKVVRNMEIDGPVDDNSENWPDPDFGN